MADKNKATSPVVLDITLLSKENGNKFQIAVRTKNAIVSKDEIVNQSYEHVSNVIKSKINELSKINAVEKNAIPIFMNKQGTSEQIVEMLESDGYTVVTKDKTDKSKTKSYYDYYYDEWVYEPLTPWGVINFDQLKEAESAKELKEDFSELFVQYIEMGQRIIDGNYVLEFGDERGALSLMTDLTNQFLVQLEKTTAEHKGSVRKELNLNPETEEEAFETVKELIEDAAETFIEENAPEGLVKEHAPESELVVKSKGVMLFKNAKGELIWAGIHSNKFQDRDFDILKEKSHKRFVKMVENGEYDYPELWIWHIQKAVGEVNWLAYDDRGFLLSGGLVYPDYEELITTLVKNTPEMGMSHGMPVESVVYDKEGYIDEYKSIEVTMLPLDEASNILTSFTVESK